MKQINISILTLASCLLLPGCWEHSTAEKSTSTPEVTTEHKSLSLDALLEGKSGTEKLHELISKGNVIVDFYAPWCPPCKALLPVVEQIAQEFDPHVKIVKVDIDKFDEIASGFQVGNDKITVSSIPHVFFFKDGVLVDQFKGGRPHESFKEKVVTIFGIQ